MEILLGIIVLIYALSFLLDKLIRLLKQLGTSKDRKLLSKGNALHIECNIDCIDKKEKAHTRSMDHSHDNLD